MVTKSMSIPNPQAALLVLADGTAYPGYSFGVSGTVIGEVVFNTGITGYQEILTDPSYCGQIVTFTYPELGNTGINPEDEESARPQVRGRSPETSVLRRAIGDPQNLCPTISSAIMCWESMVLTPGP